MKKNLIVLCLTLLAAGIYCLFIQYSKLAVTDNGMTYKSPQESSVFQFKSISSKEIDVIPCCDQYLYCLLPLSFVEKMEGFGVSAEDFIKQAGENLEGPTVQGQSIQLTQTTSMSILNYVHTPSSALESGKTYVMLVGEIGNDLQVSFRESIEIKL